MNKNFIIQNTEGFNDKPEGFNDKPEGFNDKPEGFNDKPEGFNDKPEGGAQGGFKFPLILICLRVNDIPL